METKHPFLSVLRLVAAILAALLILGATGAVLARPDAAPSAGPVPPYVNYQGYATDNAGLPITGTVNVTFSIHTQATGGSRLWIEANKPLTASGGYFGTLLGSASHLTPTLFDGSTLYLQVQMDGSTPFERMPLTSVPYALRATEAVSASHANTADHAATASLATNATYAVSAGYAITAGDADKLDGYHASAFALAGHLHDDRYVNEQGPDDMQSTSITPTFVITNNGSGPVLLLESSGGAGLIAHSTITGIAVRAESVTGTAVRGRSQAAFGGWFQTVRGRTGAFGEAPLSFDPSTSAQGVHGTIAGAMMLPTSNGFGDYGTAGTTFMEFGAAGALGTYPGNYLLDPIGPAYGNGAGAHGVASGPAYVAYQRTGLMNMLWHYPGDAGVWGESMQATPLGGRQPAQDIGGPARGVYGSVNTFLWVPINPEPQSGELGYNTAGVHGVNTRPSGVFPWNNNFPTGPGTVAPSTYGVLGDNGIPYAEDGVVVSQSRLGVLGTVSSGREAGTSSAGVMGINGGPVSPPRGVFPLFGEEPLIGLSSVPFPPINAPVEAGMGGAPAEYGVRGTTTSTINGSAGVLGETRQRDTAGIYGRCVIPADQGTPGEPGACYGVYSDGDMYVDGNLYVTGAKAGYVIDLAINASDEALETGDVVVIVGVADPVVGDIPTPLVVKAAEANDTAVMGVVEMTRDGTNTVAPGQVCKVVTLGAFKAVKVDASTGAIGPGDLLVASATPGHAQKAGPESGIGTVIGKALGAIDDGTGVIEILVTLK